MTLDGRVKPCHDEENESAGLLVHPAHTMPFADLAAGLRAARDERLVYERPGPDGLTLYVYTERCVFESAWTPITKAARGLILDHTARRIVATPFAKFFNVGELGEPVPDLPFEATDKLDGSLIIIFYHAGRWRAVTKGSFDSSQALWAQARLEKIDLAPLTIGTTYLAEATYPENRIVVRHTEEALRLLAAYAADGTELALNDVIAAGTSIGLDTVARVTFASIPELVLHAKYLPKSHEGYVIRFSNGHRLKVKGDEYRRIHALISGLSPLSVWQAMQAGDDMLAIRRDLPEEFWDDFDNIQRLLAARVTAVVERAEGAAATVATLTDKEVGLRLASFDADIRGLLFDIRKTGAGWTIGRARQKLFRLIRPEANVLPGYVPSSSLIRAVEEAQG